ncbi:protein-L-isoaspartate O-methyltransferase [Pseudonocardia saturnea]|nr:protein-L-isoaspartate O-methyltransferase [Pseudonocardia autotrophica]GEC29694.1 protein-L-isoaspartate O-methyltransferase [Pseudonocardia saturnea]
MGPDPTHARRRDLAGTLADGGWLRSPEWRVAFETVPRHLYVPRAFGFTSDRSAHQAIGSDDPRWLDLVYDDQAITTQLDADDTRWDHARDHGPVLGTVTSSSSQPSLMAGMLESLDIADGHQVLELGTGTGYNTALLCHRLGADLVTSVEYDPVVAEYARHVLYEQGLRPSLAVGDGAAGVPERAPFDRVIATYGTTAVPPAWVAQTRPGGIIVASLNDGLGAGIMVRLVVDDHGAAHGHLTPDDAHFMPTRTEVPTRIDELLRAAATGPDGRTRTARLPAIVPDRAPGWAVLAALRYPGIARVTLHRDDGTVQWLVHPDGSWAYRDPATDQVEQAGPRQLWDLIEDAHDQWLALGAPDRTRFGITVVPGGRRVWLDDPDGPRTWPTDADASDGWCP